MFKQKGIFSAPNITSLFCSSSSSAFLSSYFQIIEYSCFKTCGSESRAPEGRGPGCLSQHFISMREGGCGYSHPEAVSNRRFVTCKPRDVRFARRKRGCFMGVIVRGSSVCVCVWCVCVCDYLSTEDNVSGLAGLIHAKNHLWVLSWPFVYPCKLYNSCLFYKLTWTWPLDMVVDWV